MAEVQDVEAAVGNDKFFAAGAKTFSPRRQLIPRDDFTAEIHTPILPTGCRLATIYGSVSVQRRSPQQWHGRLARVFLVNAGRLF
jgi:hypothetical protein